MLPCVIKENQRRSLLTQEKIISPLKTLHLDVTNEKSILKAMKKIIDEKGRIDILINNAGYSLLGPLEQLEIDEIKDEFETNFLA